MFLEERKVENEKWPRSCSLQMTLRLGLNESPYTKDSCILICEEDKMSDIGAHSTQQFLCIYNLTPCLTFHFVRSQD